MKQPRARLVCRAKQAVEQKEPHLAPIPGGEKLVPISSRAISHRGYSLGKQGTELCVPREGGICAAMALTCLLGSRFDLGSSQVIIRQKKKSTLSGSFLLLCGGVFVLDFTVLVFRGFWLFNKFTEQCGIDIVGILFSWPCLLTCSFLHLFLLTQ